MRSILFLVALSISFTSCKRQSENSAAIAKDSSINIISPPPEIKISWSTSREIFKIDVSLTHDHGGFKCDSAIAVDYIGFRGDDIYTPLNDSGQWISTIKKRKKLSSEQLQLVHSVLGNKKTFENPRIVSCYEPRLGIVYFKNNRVIAQSAICLGCPGLQSTAKLGNGTYYYSFNKEATRQLGKLCSDLAFSECNPWKD